MTVFQLLMLGASAFFAFKIYEHIQTLKETEEGGSSHRDSEEKSRDAFSIFSPEALIEKADKAYEEDDFQKALAFLNEANVKGPNNPETVFKIAYILQKSGNNEEAMKHYKQALELDKENEFIHNSMASIYRANGEFTSAKIHLKASLDIDANNPITCFNYGNLLVDMQHNEEAIAMYKKALELDPDLQEAKIELDKLEKE
ncbi:MAG: tetratricopeptide repeat protein [Epsilonproteobacteria bacterium]|nr:tetratricopeptide repeat protein [Campylobacterota bacterium]OIO17140.1 MAG: hypothetical protein AUJ81_02620 [Helicobacteraceae bacterium CG1_02_36_14]PIP10110.1 MAG: hypothetical protein COX50_06440 [Sulfurimonas sp. CG23_combo_of_CG06-09_8_20_14_all_36_33]PIS26571.1 MAG: hypothetical protein COT46_03020 [Sulfurimonas sp. CG08_land_8_20_14_0_20_36_33]PIU34032.1 MAG: hypothetical protein COT05_10425 [Sulfurimonas sp. CG07_land_8_20_14_0_80_36_56]PIV03860.1 MAG: hypothetical protein COS56_0